MDALTKDEKHTTESVASESPAMLAPETVSTSERTHRHAVLALFVVALLILFCHLGTDSLRGSEGRWAVIARGMLRSGHFFNPMLGIRPYWDKPLLSYWQILPGAFCVGGVSEFAARLPSALWGLMLALLTFDLARKTFGRDVAVYTTAILLTTVGFVKWSRDAQVEMTNASMSVLAIWYFLRHRSDKGHGWVYVLGAIMAVAANMKGLLAYGMPFFCIAAWSFAARDWRWLPPWRVLTTAGLASLALYLALPIVAGLLGDTWEPLRLVWRENVVRFFSPFDHKDPVYTYFIRIFDLAAPWSLFFPVAGVYYFRKKRYREPGNLTTVALAAAVFLFFTLCGSRRPYYLLPILPFTSILLARFIVDFGSRELSPGLDRATRAIGVFLGVVLLAPFFVLACRLPGLPPTAHELWPVVLMTFGAGVTMIASTQRRWTCGMVAALLLTCVTAVVQFVPWAAKESNLKSDVERVRSLGNSFAFVRGDDARVVFYLDRPYRIFADADDARAWAAKENGVLIEGDDPKPAGWQVELQTRTWTALTLETSGKEKKVVPATREDLAPAPPQGPQTDSKEGKSS